MRKAILIITLALCLTIMISTASLAAPRVDPNLSGLDFGVCGVAAHGQGEFGIGGFVDFTLALSEHFALRFGAARTLFKPSQLTVAEATAQANLSEYAALYLGGLYLGAENSTSIGNISYIFPQTGLILHCPIGNLSLYGLFSMHYDWKNVVFVPGYGAYLTIDFGKGFGFSAGMRGFGTPMTKSPMITTGFSYSF
ncbi:MAG TPA: hypothetical protein DHD79_08150 [Firmicutes bacterium]|jgi:hypothetical protein|nr:hypothetical protein [Bacillota bacterium]HBE07404.1 hypothetical protein [Bacillota bacterium]HBG43730.1 hypothetical protein [Bacillota bacterium]HBL49935.1 hypothetical protein [Bacillota bacterium]HCF89523.1 hypothetical protein [Bacillota bacterium]